MTKKQKQVLYLFGLPIILGTILLLGISYAFLTLTLTGEKGNNIRVGTLSLKLDDTLDDGIQLEGEVPKLDEVGKLSIPYRFTLTNNGTVDSNYTIYLDDVALDEGELRLADSNIKYHLLKDAVLVNMDLVSTLGENPNRILEQGVIQAGTKKEYELRFWIDENAGNEIMNKVFSTKIRVVANQIPEKVPTDESCFTFDEKTKTITGYSSSCPKDVVIPDKINGIAVKHLGTFSFASKSITSVVIPRGIEQISSFVFYMDKLTSVVIPDTVKLISVSAFSNNQIVSLEIPSSVTAIGPGAFNNNLLTGDQGFIYKRNSDGSVDKTTIVSYAGANRDKIIIPSNVTVIGQSAFQDMGMKELVLPSGLKTIGKDAFHNNMLTEINIPKSVTSIGGGAFTRNNVSGDDGFVYQRKADGTIDNTILMSYAGNQKANVVIPSSVTTIGTNAFSNSYMTSVILPDNLQVIEQTAFNVNNLTTVTIPSSVTTIGPQAFGRNSLTTVIIKGKSSVNDFASYPETTPFGWKDGYSDANITWNG